MSTIFLFLLFITSETLFVNGRTASVKCKNPRGSEGDAYSTDCIKHVCESDGTEGIWIDQPDTESCCYQNGTAYKTGAVIEIISNNCTETKVVCKSQQGSPAILTRHATPAKVKT